MRTSGPAPARAQGAPMSFDLQHYLDHSRAIDVSDIDWAAAADVPVPPEHVRCLTYMMDIESHTIMYLRDLLNSRAVANPDISAFLACWVYEETFHGRAFERFLNAIGEPVAANRVEEIRTSTSWRATVDLIGTFVVSRVSRHFPAAYLTWGAINELTTHFGYRLLLERTENPVLAKLLRRVMRDESRHFAFYYHEAGKRLGEPGAQRLTRFLLKRFWGPVGTSVKSDDDVAFITAYLFAGTQGKAAIEHIEQTIRRLPGLEWFDMLGQARESAVARYGCLRDDPVPAGA